MRLRLNNNEVNRIQNEQVMDSSTKWGLKHFDQEEMTNDTISCSYVDYEPNVLLKSEKPKLKARSKTRYRYTRAESTTEHDIIPRAFSVSEESAAYSIGGGNK